MNISAVKKAARKYGLSKLSKDTGFARSHLYKIFDGSSSPTLEAFSKIAEVLGFRLELHRKFVKDSVLDVSMQAEKDGNWKIHFFNFVDSFRRTKNLALIEDPPSKGLGEKERILLASMVMALCSELKLQTPHWPTEMKPLKDPWFVAGMENLKAIAIVESSPFFKRNNIFVLSNFLSRA